MALLGHGRGTDHARSRAISARSAPRTSFESFASTRGISLDPKHEADFQLLRYAEHLLASAIGAASSRLVLSLLLRKRTVSTKAALKLLDDANAAIQYNREILQTALDHVRQGIAVFDKDLQLICWNRQFGDILDLPPAADARRHRARRNPALQRRARADRDAGRVDDLVRDRSIAAISPAASRFRERFAERGLVIEVRANRMPDGGLVTTFTDITPSVEAAEALERANETLERRVRERTEQLTRLNTALARAKGEAEEANISKTRFLAAASHDILQPLNAARLYVTSLIERQGSGEDARLVGNIDASLEAVEEILGALLDISRLDTGAMRPEIVELPDRRAAAPARGRIRADRARARGSSSTFVPTARSRCARTGGCCAGCCRTSSPTRSNTRREGRVLVGCRRRRRPAADRRLRHRARHSASQATRRSSRNSTGSTRAPRSRAASASACRSSSGSRACSITRSRCNSTIGPRLALLGRGAACAGAAEPRARARAAAASIAASSPASIVLCIDNEPTSSTAWRRCSRGWGCQVLKAPDLETALATIERSRVGAERPAGRLSPRQRQRHRGDHGAALALRRRPAGHPDHRRPQRRTCARKRARATSRCSTSRSSRPRCAR